MDDKTGEQVLKTAPDGSRVPQNYAGTSLGEWLPPGWQQHAQLTKRKPPRMVAGLAAYFRGIAAMDESSKLFNKLKEPKNVVCHAQL